jgi:hypothetical protein
MATLSPEGSRSAAPEADGPGGAGVPRFVGNVDGTADGHLVGWAWDPTRPGEPVRVDLLIEGQVVLSAVADQYREDLAAGGIGEGRHAFRVALPLDILLRAPVRLDVRVSGTAVALANSPLELRRQHPLRIPSLKIDPFNVRAFLRQLDGDVVEYLLLDINDQCNAECIYCPNLRSKARIELDDFDRLITTGVREVGVLQFGCGQEPTVDRRLPEFFLRLRRAAGIGRVQIVTNGMLLHRYDHRLLHECGLTHLMLSLDTADAQTFETLRPGTHLEQILQNVRRFRESCPEVVLLVSAVVTSLNAGGIEGLIELGESLGVSEFFFREVFDPTEVEPVFAHAAPRLEGFADTMAALALPPGAFERLQQRLQAFRPAAIMHFESRSGLTSFSGGRVTTEETVLASTVGGDSPPPAAL